jgi:hypothetical protein
LLGAVVVNVNPATVSSTTRRHLLRTNSNVDLLNSQPSIQITYSVTYTVYSDASNKQATVDNVYASIVNQLDADILDNQFTSTLQAQAAVLGATSLANAVADIISTFTAPTIITNSSNESNTLSGGAIAGIVLGIIFGLALIVGGVYAYMSPRR